MGTAPQRTLLQLGSWALAAVLAGACTHPAPAPDGPEQPAPAPASQATELTPEVTDPILAGAQPAMGRCYADALRADKSFHPKLLVTLHVMPDGSVGALDFAPKVPKPFADCMTSALGALRFPAIGRDTNVDFPLDLSE